MNQDYLEQITEEGRKSLKSLQDLNDINTNSLKKLTELQFNFASINQEFGVEQSRLLTSSTDYSDLVTAETELTREYSDKATDLINQANQILTETRDEVISWFEKEIGSPGKTPEKTPAIRTTRKTSREV